VTSPANRVDELRRRHALEPLDLEGASALAKALARGGDELGARQVLLATAKARDAAGLPLSEALFQGLLVLPAGSGALRRLVTFELAEIFGDATNKRHAAFVGASMAVDASGAAQVILVTDQGFAGHWAPFGVAQLVGLSAKYRSPLKLSPPGLDGSFALAQAGGVCLVRQGKERLVQGITSAAPVAPNTVLPGAGWLFGRLDGDLLYLRQERGVRSIPLGSGPVWATAAFDDGLVVCTDGAGLTVVPDLHRQDRLHRCTDARLLSSRVRLTIDGQHAALLVFDNDSDERSLHRYTWASARWTQVELSGQPRAWLLEPNQGRFATWFDERSGELVDLDADTRRTLDHGAEVVALLPEAEGRFVVVVFGERVELWV